jgi:hypothetical protein
MGTHNFRVSDALFPFMMELSVYFIENSYM